MYHQTGEVGGLDLRERLFWTGLIPLLVLGALSRLLPIPPERALSAGLPYETFVDGFLLWLFSPAAAVLSALALGAAGLGLLIRDVPYSRTMAAVGSALVLALVIARLSVALRVI